MQRDGHMPTDCPDDAFTKPHRNWVTRTRLRPGTTTRRLRTTPIPPLELAEISRRIRFDRY